MYKTVKVPQNYVAIKGFIKKNEWSYLLIIKNKQTSFFKILQNAGSMRRDLRGTIAGLAYWMTPDRCLNTASPPPHFS
jgi:hypothetical protein